MMIYYMAMGADGAQLFSYRRDLEREIELTRYIIRYRVFLKIGGRWGVGLAAKGGAAVIFFFY